MLPQTKAGRLAPAQGAPATEIQIEPASQTVRRGGTAAVQVLVVGVQDLFAYNLAIVFDPRVLQVRDEDAT